MAGFEPAASCSQISFIRSPDVAWCRPVRRSPGTTHAARRLTWLSVCTCRLPLWLPPEAALRIADRRADGRNAPVEPARVAGTTRPCRYGDCDTEARIHRCERRTELRRTQPSPPASSRRAPAQAAPRRNRTVPDGAPRPARELALGGAAGAFSARSLASSVATAFGRRPSRHPAGSVTLTSVRGPSRYQWRALSAPRVPKFAPEIAHGTR
jgi:hypothetical protein